MGFQTALTDNTSRHQVKAGDAKGLVELIERVRARVARQLSRLVEIASCYEAGDHGFWLHRVVVHSRNIPSDLASRLFRKLQMLDDATTDQDLRMPPSNHSEKLRGKLEGFHSIRVNSQWRLIFRWDRRRGEASRVYLDDHSYR